MTDINTRRLLDENTRLKRQLSTQAENFEQLRLSREAAVRTVRAYQQEYGPLAQSRAGRALGEKRRGV